MIDERDGAVGTDLGVEAHLGIGRPALDQSPAGIVADAAQNRGAYAGGADYRMGLAPERAQALLQLIQRGAGQAAHLLAAVDQVDALEAHDADQHDLAVVILAPGGRAAGQPCVGGLEDHRAPGLDGDVQHPPHLDQRAGTNDRRHWAAAIAEAARIASGCRTGG